MSIFLPMSHCGALLFLMFQRLSLSEGVFGETNQSELAAFVSYALAFPDNFLALVDTYDVSHGISNPRVFFFSFDIMVTFLVFAQHLNYLSSQVISWLSLMYLGRM